MTLLILGLLIWWGAHLFKRVMPAQRAALQERMGEGSKGVFAVALLASVALMVLGYKAADFTPVYDPPGWGLHLNNLLMILAVGFIGLGHSKSRLRGRVRHPMLIGFIIWTVAHLLVNGDLASVLLFAGLGAWAVASIFIINTAEPSWERYEGGSVAGDMRLAGITAGVFIVVSLLHWWAGYWPFPG